MNTPQRALNVARLAAWGAIAVAGAHAASLIGLILRVGLGPALPAFLGVSTNPEAFALAGIVGLVAYLRPALWSIALAMAVIALDAVYELFDQRGLNFNVFLDAFLFVFAINSFRGLRRYRELTVGAAESAFD